MAIREIPRAFIYICDSCGVEHKQENATGHYTESTPDGWTKLVRYQRSQVPPSSSRSEWLLCSSCAADLEPHLPEAP